MPNYAQTGSILNGVADSANYLRQNDVRVPGNSFARNDISQTLNGQITITQDGSALKIGTEPTFIIERTGNGSNANFVNSFQGFGSFTFNIKDNNFANLRILTVGGEDKQVKIYSTTPAKNTATGALVVAGGASIGQDLYVGGKLTFTDAATTITVANLVLTGTTPASTSSGTLIVAGGAHIGGNARINGSLDIANKLLLNGSVGAPGQILVTDGYSRAYWANFDGSTSTTSTSFSNLTITGGMTLTNASNISVSTTTGALVVAGGIGVGGNINIAGTTRLTVLTATNANLTSLTVSQDVRVQQTTNSTSTITGALTVSGGVGIAKDLFVGGTIFASTLTIQNTIINTTTIDTDDVISTTNNTDSSSTTTGALKIAGGAGIRKNLYVGGKVVLNDTTPTTSSTTGALTVAGGVGIQGELTVDGPNIYLNSSEVITTATLGGASIDGSSLESTNGIISVNTATLMANAVTATFVTTPATSTVLGGVKIGENINVTVAGVISLSPATSSKLGLVKISNNAGLSNSEGVIGVVTATSTRLGAVQIGSNITVAANGTISVAAPYVLPPATFSTIGGVKPGNGVSVDSSGTISVNTSSFAYTLPCATTSTLGGVTVNPDRPSIFIDFPTGVIGVNYNFTATNGLIITHQWNAGNNWYDLIYGLSTASSTQLGGVKIGNGFAVDLDGTINVTTASYSLFTASSTILGGVKIGTGVDVSADGTISVYTGTPYVLATATSISLGGVKIGSNISAAADGTISVAAPYVLTTATAASLGGVKIGSNIDVDPDGTISVSFPGGYTLTTATALALGGVKIGSNISIDGDGVISVAGPYVLTTATNSLLGGIKIGSGLSSIADGTLSVDTSTLMYQAFTATYASYVTVPATTSTLGGVKAGTNITIDPDGTISVPTFPLNTATAFVLGGVRIGNNVNIDSNGIISVTSLNARLSSVYNATASTGTGGIYLNGSTNNRIDFSSVGNSAPNLTSRSDGTKIVLRPGVDGTGVDVGFGTDNNTLWSSVYDNTYQYRWYAGTAPVMTLAGTGTLVVAGPITSGGWLVSTSTYTLPIASGSVLGGIKVGSGLNIAGDGTLSVPSSGYVLPAATTSTLGGVIVPPDSNINLDVFGNISFSTATLVNTSVLATQATKLQNARFINGESFDGTSNITISATTTNLLNFGTGLSGSSFNGSSAVTVSVNQATTTTLGGIYGVVGDNIAIGSWSGLFNQRSGTVAVGYQAGQDTQGTNAVAIGTDTGVTSQGAGAIAIGGSAGNTSQGANSIAVGYLAGSINQAANSIVINASGAQLNTSTANSLVIKPIRANGSTEHFLFYNPGSGEVTTASTLANIVRISNATQATATATGALQVAGGVSVGGNNWVGGYSILKSITTSSVNTLGTGTPTGATVYFTDLVPAKIGVYNGTAWADALGIVLF